jgi:hypothetical protein
LARLIPLWPHELADVSPAGRTRLVAKLEAALRAERRRGRAGHWSYDLARHAALLGAWRTERAALAAPEAPTHNASRERKGARAHRPAPARKF